MLLFLLLLLLGHYHFDRLHHNGFKKLEKFGPVVREEIVPNVNIVWLFRPEDIQIMYQCEGKYPQRRSHLALEKYRLDKSDLYNTGGLLPTLVKIGIILISVSSTKNIKYLFVQFNNYNFFVSLVG